MAAIPFMPLYVADYLSDAAHLTTVEHGAFLLLLMTYWQRGEPLPDDDRKLARICRLEPRSWKRIRPTISEFFEVSDGKWLNGRAERELASVRDKSLKNRKGGLARAQQALSERSANAQPYTTDTDTVIPFPNGNGAVDPDKQFWDGAKLYLGKSRGSKIGQWVRDYGRDETGKAITEAQLNRVVDPVSYIERVLKGGAKRDPVIGI